MRVAVTGATGFIGKHVLAELGRHSVEVVSVVRPSPHNPQCVSMGSVVHFDLHNTPSGAFELMGCPDVLIHLAWEGLPNYNYFI